MVSAVAQAVAAPQQVKGGMPSVQSQQSILDVAKIEEGVQDIDLKTKAPGDFDITSHVLSQIVTPWSSSVHRTGFQQPRDQSGNDTVA